MAVIGAAGEFWRIRLTRVDTTDDLTFEWHEDILYRTPATEPAEELELWFVEAVRLEDSDDVVRLDTFTDRDQAEKHLDRVSYDLGELTRSQFEETYVAPARVAQDAAD